MLDEKQLQEVDPALYPDLDYNDCKTIAEEFLSSELTAQAVYHMKRGTRAMKPNVKAAIQMYQPIKAAFKDRLQDAEESHKEAVKRAATAFKQSLVVA